MHYSLRIIHWNCQGIDNKYAELTQLINHVKVYIISDGQKHDLSQQCRNPADKRIHTRMENNNYTVVPLETSIYYPDIHHHRPYILEITIIKANNLKYTIKNLNQLSSDHNPIMLDIKGKPRHSASPPTLVRL